MKLKEIVTKKNVFEIAKFLIVGIINALLLMGVYNLCLLVMNYIIAYGIGFIVSVVSAFLLNKFFVFKRVHDKKTSWLSFGKVFIVYFATFLLGLLLVYIFVDLCGLYDKIAPVLNIIITTPINYFLVKFWALKATKVSEIPEEETTPVLSETSLLPKQDKHSDKADNNS